MRLHQMQMVQLVLDESLQGFRLIKNIPALQNAKFSI